jgi:hypothetical protein
MKKLNLTLVVAVVLFFVYLFVKDRYYKPKELKENGILLTASTMEWQQSTKAGFGLKYEFFFDGKKITGYAASKYFAGNINFAHKYFPVIYAPKYGHKELLIEPRRFKEYNIPFPDSLKWVLPYIKE